MEDKKAKNKAIISVLKLIIIIEFAIFPLYFFLVAFLDNSCNGNGKSPTYSTEIYTFNSLWESYVGDNKSASEVRTLLTAICANNASERKNGRNRIVKLNGISDGNELQNLIENYYYIDKYKTYSVKTILDDENEYVSNIIVTEEIN